MMFLDIYSHPQKNVNLGDLLFHLNSGGVWPIRAGWDRCYLVTIPLLVKKDSKQIGCTHMYKWIPIIPNT